MDAQNIAVLEAAIRDALAHAERVADDPERFSVYENNPVEFCNEVLGIPLIDLPNEISGLWSKQVEILEAAITEAMITIRSGHGEGKTFAMALLALWWLYARHGLVITTASTWNQVEKVLWREIASLHGRARVKLPGELLNAELRISRDWFALGMSTDNPTAFQGQHHPRLLVIVDEAPGVGEDIHKAIGSLATGEKNCIVMVGNPTELSGTFYESFRRGSWHRIHMSCLDHPNVVTGKEIIPGAVTRRWVEQVRTRWGERSPYYACRVLGEFPRTAGSSVISLDQVERSQDVARWQKALAAAEARSVPRIFGVDVARKGHNRTVVAVRRGDAIEALLSWSGLETMETVGLIRVAATQYEPAIIVVDEVGVGAGVLDRLVELDYPALGFHSGRTAQNRALFGNRRSEHWWHLRERFEADTIRLPPDDGSPDIQQTRTDLTAPTYKIASTGRIQVERKEEMEARGVDSPDFADAIAMCFILDEEGAETEPEPLDNVDPTRFLAVPDDETSDFGTLPFGF